MSEAEYPPDAMLCPRIDATGQHIPDHDIDGEPCPGWAHTAERMFIDRAEYEANTFHVPKPEFALAMREDDGTLIVGIRPDGSITTGPRYEPDAAAREFWDAVTRAAQAANPWGHA